MEGVPEELNLDALRSQLEKLPGVREVHDLHVWSVTSGQHNLTAHLVSDAPPADLLERVQGVARQYDLGHSTVQIEAPGLHAEGEDHHDHGELHP